MVLGVVCKDAWKNNYRGNSSSKPTVIYDSCYLPCVIAPVSLTRASSCYLSCVMAPVSLTRVASCYLSCVIAPVSLTRAASCYLPCAIAPVSLTRAASCYLPCAETPELLTGVSGFRMRPLPWRPKSHHLSPETDRLTSFEIRNFRGG